MQIAPSATRVQRATLTADNERIHNATRANILYYSQHPEDIDARLEELEHEWDTERVLETNAATLAFTGTLLGLVDRRWLLLPLAVTGFLFQHGVQGWCPPLPLLRRLGVRTPREIEAERYALKAIRGDFDEAANDRAGADAAAEATGRLVTRRGPHPQARTVDNA